MSYIQAHNIKELNIIKLALDQIEDWVLVTNKEGVIIYVNSAVEKLSGYTKEELIGKKPSVLKSSLVAPETYQQLWATILNGGVYENVIANRHKEGHLYYLATTISPIKGQSDKIEYFISIAKDTSNEDKLIKQIHDTLHYDHLTGLLNRNSFIESISEIKSRPNKLAILALTINRLGLINSQYSFESGDRVIKEVAFRLEKILDKNAVLSRPEGKVFAILLGDFKSPVHIVKLIGEIEDAFKEPIEIKNEQIYISLTFGISIHMEEIGSGIDGDTLLTNAQLALSKAKNKTSLENYEFYTPSMNDQVSNQMNMEKEIYEAFENKEFTSYFQPIIDIRTGEISSLEALIRREKTTGEIVSPSEFINFIEETGLIVEIGFNQIKEICKQMNQWIEEYGYSLPVSINLSSMQFKDEHFCEKVVRLVKKEGIPPHLITFEITESMLIEDVKLTIQILENLKSQGFTIAIDDFGTGYSSLSYIQKFKIDHIKIDLSFIRHITDNEADQTIVKAIIMMAKGLQLKAVAEGIETKQQLDMIQKLGCHMGQGYYWERPLSAAEITQKYFTISSTELRN